MWLFIDHGDLIFHRAVSILMMGRPGARRATSLKPALRKAEAIPVQAKTSGIGSFLGSTGYPSIHFAPSFRARATAAFNNSTLTPARRNGFAMKKHVTDHTGRSSTGARIREFSIRS